MREAHRTATNLKSMVRSAGWFRATTVGASSQLTGFKSIKRCAVKSSLKRDKSLISKNRERRLMPAGKASKKTLMLEDNRSASRQSLSPRRAVFLSGNCKVCN